MNKKLSELSKPVACIVRWDGGEVASIKMGIYTAPKGFTSAPLYSQEYVSALLAELEAKDRQIAHQKICFDNESSSNAWAFNRIRELTERAEAVEQKLATPVRLSDTTHHRCRLQHADDIRAAGFKCVGDE